MTLAILLLILAGMTTFATVVIMATEPNAGKRVTTVVFSIAYVVVMTLSAVALM